MTDRTKNLKILFAITKSPKMSSLVYQAERKRISAEKQKKIQDEAILTLRKYRFDEGDNVAKFVENVYNDVFG